MALDYLPTGIPGMDTILGAKGIPRGHTILVSGGPGSGKTTFAIQFLYNGAVNNGEPGLYVTLDEDPEDIKTNMLGFGWDLEQLERDNQLRFINVSPVRLAPSEGTGLIQLGMKEFRLTKLLESIRAGIEEIQARRLVIDPITIFMLQYPDEIERIHDAISVQVRVRVVRAPDREQREQVAHVHHAVAVHDARAIVQF